jgi:hypothetical protein
MPGIKGADRCPRCGSRKTSRAPFPTEEYGNFYARVLALCLNPACKASWEPFDPADLLDDGDPTSSFREPCDNCAFRAGSVEQSNPAKWAKLMSELKVNGAFYCHKGVPLDPASENGFAYPLHKRSKMRYCRGWLKMLSTRMDKATKKEIA